MLARHVLANGTTDQVKWSINLCCPPGGVPSKTKLMFQDWLRSCPNDRISLVFNELLQRDEKTGLSVAYFILTTLSDRLVAREINILAIKKRAQSTESFNKLLREKLWSADREGRGWALAQDDQLGPEFSGQVLQVQTALRETSKWYEMLTQNMKHVPGEGRCGVYDESSELVDWKAVAHRTERVQQQIEQLNQQIAETKGKLPSRDAVLVKLEEYLKDVAQQTGAASGLAETFFKPPLKKKLVYKKLQWEKWLK